MSWRIGTNRRPAVCAEGLDETLTLHRLGVYGVLGRSLKTDEPFARNLALSPDPEQRFLYVGGGSGIMVLDRPSLDVLTTIETTVGTGHHIQTDSQGNLYIAATGAGFQRLVFTGLSPTTE